MMMAAGEGEGAGLKCEQGCVGLSASSIRVGDLPSRVLQCILILGSRNYIVGAGRWESHNKRLKCKIIPGSRSCSFSWFLMFWGWLQGKKRGPVGDLKLLVTTFVGEVYVWLLDTCVSAYSLS